MAGLPAKAENRFQAVLGNVFNDEFEKQAQDEEEDHAVDQQLKITFDLVWLSGEIVMLEEKQDVEEHQAHHIQELENQDFPGLVIADAHFKGKSQQYHRDLDGSQDLQLEDEVGVEEGMGQAFHEGTDAVEEDHEGVGTGEPVHVHQEVPGQLPVPAVVQGVADEGSEHH